MIARLVMRAASSANSGQWGAVARSLTSRQSDCVTAYGRQDGEPLVVDLRSRGLESWSQLWDALAETCGLPSWFGRSLDAWWDTIEAGGISDVLDDHSFVTILVSAQGLFAPGAGGDRFIQTTNESEYARAEVEST